MSCSSPKITPAAMTMGEKTPSLCGFPPPVFFGFLGAISGLEGVGVVMSTAEDVGIGGMSIISFVCEASASDDCSNADVSLRIVVRDDDGETAKA